MRLLALAALAALAPGCQPMVHAPSGDSLRLEVMAAERAFARTMADRDHVAFTSFLAPEAVFLSGDAVLRGSEAVAAGWHPLFEGPVPPFSWEPDRVEVLESGALALSTGPVRDPAGRIVNRFTSIWRREAPGVWRVVFDSGSPVCDTPAASGAPAPAGAEGAFLGIFTAGYRVPDLAAAREWYSRALGGPPYFDEPFYVGFDVSGYELGLQPQEGHERSGAGGVVAYWGVPEADLAVARLLELGATLHSGVQEVGGGIRVATVLDPFGNVLGLVENPHFRPGRPGP
jgi:ketosteroid isomerase-like protein/predicted enzyme related to lactoylglutathione lyase